MTNIFKQDKISVPFKLNDQNKVAQISSEPHQKSYSDREKIEIIINLNAHTCLVLRKFFNHNWRVLARNRDIMSTTNDKLLIRSIGSDKLQTFLEQLHEKIINKNRKSTKFEVILPQIKMFINNLNLNKL